MRKVNLLLLGFLVGFLFVTTSCDKDDDPVAIVESEVLAEYLEANGDFANTYLPTIMGAADVKTLMATNSVYIVDIRGAEDYAKGHIGIDSVTEYAHIANVATGDIITHVKALDLSGYEKVAVVCYTGQTASFATSLLQLAGINKAYTMMWGMSGWNADFAGSWNSSISNSYATQFEDTDVPKGAVGDLPTISTGETEGAAILDAQINTVLAAGFGEAAITNAMVMDNPDNYYVINYWSAEDYTHYGHIPGAMQYTPKGSISLATDLKTIPADKTVVVYCWTGQTSAFLTSYLKVLGYDAKSLKFGANGMIYDELESHKWTAETPAGYDYVK